MIEVTQKADKNIIEFELSGEISADDYEKTLIPTLEENLQKFDKVNILYHAGENFKSYELKALYDDAKMGFKFFNHWNKIAVVSDVEWIVNGVKFFAFSIPGEIKIFNNSELEKAREWLSQKEVLSPNIKITLEKESKIAILKLEKSLSKDDFLYAKSIIDPFIEQNGKLNGIIIYTKDFPYWNSFSGFISHMKFIKNHHQDVKRLAFVTDSFVGEVGEHVGSHFVSAEVKNFDFDALKEAKEWIVSN
jgi:pantothenate kinase